MVFFVDYVDFKYFSPFKDFLAKICFISMIGIVTQVLCFMFCCNPEEPEVLACVLKLTFGSGTNSCHTE